MKIDVSPCLFFFFHTFLSLMPYSFPLSTCISDGFFQFSVFHDSDLSAQSTSATRTALAFLHLLHCLTTCPFTHFENDLASFFIKIGLEVAGGECLEQNSCGVRD